MSETNPDTYREALSTVSDKLADLVTAVQAVRKVPVPSQSGDCLLAVYRIMGDVTNATDDIADRIAEVVRLTRGDDAG